MPKFVTLTHAEYEYDVAVNPAHVSMVEQAGTLRAVRGPDGRQTGEEFIPLPGEYDVTFEKTRKYVRVKFAGTLAELINHLTAG